MLRPNLFFRRTKTENDESKDYYSTEILVNTRYKIVMTIYSGLVGTEIPQIVFDMERELGRPLSKKMDLSDRLNDFMSNCNDDEFLSLIEIILSNKWEIFLEERKKGYPEPSYFETPPELMKKQLISLVNDINKIFRIDKVGYEIVVKNDEIVPFMVVPFNSEYLHQETIKKPMSLMYDENFKGPLNEFENALNEYGHQDYKKSIHLANNAYESTLKTILELKSIEHSKYDKIPHLVDKIKNKSNIIDSNLMSAFDSVWGILKNGPNTIRNLEGIGHGQGKEVKEIKKSYSSLVLRLVGTYIAFLIERYNETNS